MKMARYLGCSVASSRRPTSEPLRISGERRGTLALGMPVVTTRLLSPVVAKSRQRTADRFTFRVRGERPLRARSSRKPSTSLVVTVAGGLPTWARKRRAQWANVYAVFGRSPGGLIEIFVLS